jgi:hypothetical protein
VSEQDTQGHYTRDVTNVKDYLRYGCGALQTLPLEQYGGHDIVLWGERELVEAGDIQGARK